MRSPFVCNRLAQLALLLIVCFNADLSFAIIENYKGVWVKCDLGSVSRKDYVRPAYEDAYLAMCDRYNDKAKDLHGNKLEDIHSEFTEKMSAIVTSSRKDDHKAWLTYRNENNEKAHNLITARQPAGQRSKAKYKSKKHHHKKNRKPSSVKSSKHKKKKPHIKTSHTPIDG